MFPQVVKQWFWDTYDHLGRLLVLNLLLFFVFAPASFYGLGLLAVLGSRLGGPGGFLLFLAGAAVFLLVCLTVICSGLFHFGALVSAEKDPPLRAFFGGIRVCGGRVFRLLLVCVGAGGVLAGNIWWYYFSGLMPDGLRMAGFILGGLCMWLLVIDIAIAAHALPLAVRGERSTRECLRLGALLTLKYPFLTLTVLTSILGMLLIGVILKIVGLLIYGFILPALLLNSLHDVILAIETEKKLPSEEKTPATSWHEIEQESVEGEERRMDEARYDRGWSDLLRPWEM